MNQSDKDIDQLKNEFSELKMIREINRGCAAGRNTGARNSKGEYLLFLDPDTEMIIDPFQNLITELEKSIFGAAGLKLYYEDNTFQLTFGKFPDIEGEASNLSDQNKFLDINMDFILEKEYEFGDVRFVNYVSGSAFFMKKEVFELMQGFNEKFFLFYEDADMCLRLKEKGYPVFFYPFSKIIHHRDRNRIVTEEFYFHQKRSRLIYMNIHGEGLQVFFLRAYMFIKYFFLSIVGFRKIYFTLFKISLMPVSKI